MTAESGLDAVTPLWRFPYPRQLRKKRGEVVKNLRRVFRELSDQFSFINKGAPSAKDTLSSSTTASSSSPSSRQQCPAIYAVARGRTGTVCPVGHVVPSPALEAYRNKNEFSFGKDMDGNMAVGFQIGRYADGETRIGSTKGCRTAPLVALELAELSAEFAKETGLAPWDKITHEGFFRLVMVRNSAALGQAMLVMQVKYVHSFRSYFSMLSPLPSPPLRRRRRCYNVMAGLN